MFSKHIFNRSPWWLFAMVFLGTVPLSIGLLTKAVTSQIAMEEVRKNPPTETVILQDFTPDQVVNAYGETRLEGHYTGIEAVISKSKADIHYVLVLPKNGIGPGLIVQDLALNREETLGQLTSRLQPDGRVILSGFVRDDIDWEDVIRADLEYQNIHFPDQLFQLDAYWGSRDAALREFLVEQWGMAGVSAVLALILGYATRTRHRAAKQKKLERKRRAEAAAEAAWNDSPIQTQKGWFG